MFTHVRQAALFKSHVPDSGHVVYEVHWHPTYRMPCLWFTLHGLPADEPAFNLDTVFRRLVPDQFKDALRRSSGIGGISGDVSVHQLRTSQLNLLKETACRSVLTIEVAAPPPHGITVILYPSMPPR